MNKVLKELLKPQLNLERPKFVCEMDSSGMALFAGAIGLGFFNFRDNWNSLLQKEKDIQKDFSYFLRDALNEKYKRDFAEPMRWIKQGEYFECPVCHDEMALPNKYCKDCGQKLMPPEEGK
jgi:hypothetical protein